MAYQLQDAQHRIDVPSLIRRKSIGCNTNLRGHNRLELVVRNFQESKQFANQYAHIALVDQCETKVERSSTNTDIGIPQTVQYGVPVSLNCVGLHCDHLDQGIERNVSNVVVPVR